MTFFECSPRPTVRRAATQPRARCGWRRACALALALSAVIGGHAIADEGQGNTVTVGPNAIADGFGAIAIGDGANAMADLATAIGIRSLAGGAMSTAIGTSAIAQAE